MAEQPAPIKLALQRVQDSVSLPCSAFRIARACPAAGSGLLGVPVVLPGVLPLSFLWCVFAFFVALGHWTRIIFSSGPGQVINVLTCVDQVQLRFVLTSMLSDGMLIHSRRVVLCPALARCPCIQQPNVCTVEALRLLGGCRCWIG